MFENRQDAGNQLGEALEEYQAMQPLMLGIPRGGIEVGYYAALHLECDFDAIIVRKLGYPQQPEAAFGALAEDGSLYLDPWSNRYLNKEIINRVKEREKNEIQRRIRMYRAGGSLASLENRIVILIDDGIASGATVFAAIAMCQKQNPQKLIVAAPVSGYSKLSKLSAQTDEVIILEKYRDFFAVSQGYRNFGNLTDEEVLHFMKLWRNKSAGEASQG
ncbi:phosphoribosyltransferase [Fodinibius sediminis]|uniref:Predicted phosphoribosyltransferase n=1 Tax=Fodinibius sediminis TaxID=1214077 RepID=A0A521BQV5_9BACT|nr:phosphoribosyltransferase family protein [Fodinibius sediminis]SMO49131.1 Predicted phosphoribosyltransferase [Fodinibius sediminis]